MYNCDSFESVLIVLNIYYILTQKNFQISREYIYKETQYENRFIIGNKSLRRAEWKMNSSLQKLIFLFFN